jgi:hypothetical protein
MRPVGIAVCRRASERPVKPGTVEGYACEVCKEPLRLTVATARQVSAGELATFCNACGATFAAWLEASGAELEVMATPTALAQFASRPPIDPIGDFFRAHLPSCAHCGAVIRDDEEAKSHRCRKEPR